MKLLILSFFLLTISSSSIYCQISEANELTKKPAYIGGEAKLFKTIDETIIYPDEALKKKKGGAVLVRFVIDSLGNVQNPAIIKGVSEDLDQEAIRVVSSLTGWQAGEINGKKVSVWFVLSIDFKPNNYKKRK
jgi:TonB family protein